jgi:S-(hydroxymethyl)glutathione dehydrogenase / alcohol dehydrogenase
MLMFAHAQRPFTGRSIEYARRVTKVRALVLERHNEPPRLHEIDVLEPGPGEVRVRMQAAGLCHTDISNVRDARTTPLLLGHEGAGEIESVGEDVDDLRPGTRVLVCWKVPCGVCRHCGAGRLHLCEHVQELSEPRFFWAGRPLPPLLNAGCFSELVVLPAAAAIPLDDRLPDDQAALIGCAVATGVGAVLKTAEVEAGTRVGVWGAGGVGLNVIAAARLAEASVIVAVDPDPKRRELALARGATHAVEPGVDVEELDYAFEVVGEPEVTDAALSSLGIGGTLVLVGAAARDATLSFHPRAFMSKQQRIIGCIYGSLHPHKDLPELVRWCAEGLLPLDHLVGTTITLDELPAAFVEPPRDGVRTIVRFA